MILGRKVLIAVNGVTPKWSSSRFVSSNNVSADKKPLVSTPQTPATNKWISLYKFPYVHAIAGLNKIKLYQAALTSGGIPVTMMMETAEAIPAGTANVFAVLGKQNN